MPDETPDPEDADLPDGVVDGTFDDAVDEATATEAVVDGTTEEAGDDGTAEPAASGSTAADPVERDDTPPADVVDEAERLTRLARDVVDDAEADAYRRGRDRLLAAHDYVARVRGDETRDVLVLHPDAWVEDGTVRTERVDDVDRGIEVPLSGPGEGDDWAEIDAHNRDIVAAVREEHDETHAANVAALADFAGNHYAKSIDSLTAAELEDFLGEYFPRNAWPSDEQRAVVDRSVALAFDAVDERYPLE